MTVMSVLFPKIYKILGKALCGSYLKSINFMPASENWRRTSLAAVFISEFRRSCISKMNASIGRSQFRTNRCLWPAQTVGGFSLAFLGLFEKDEISVEEKIVLHIKKSILFIQREEYDPAEKELLQAFHLSRKHGLADALSQVTSYQANLALKRGNLARAEELFLFLIKRLVSLKQATQTDNSFVEISLKLAEIYARTERFDEAMSGFQYCVIVQKQKIDAGAEDEDTLALGAWSLHNLSQLYIRLGSPGDKQDIHLAKAVFCLQKAETYIAKAVGPEAQQAVAIKSDLATALALRGEHAAAFKLFGEIGEIARDKYTDLYPSIQVNVGNIYLQKSEFELANKVCNEAKDLASKFKDLEAFRRAEDCLLKSLDGRKRTADSLQHGAQPA